MNSYLFLKSWGIVIDICNSYVQRNRSSSGIRSHIFGNNLQSDFRIGFPIQKVCIDHGYSTINWINSKRRVINFISNLSEFTFVGISGFDFNDFSSCGKRKFLDPSMFSLKFRYYEKSTKIWAIFHL